jgi:hypothetical protein
LSKFLVNRSYTEIANEASPNDWDWISGPSWTTTWLDFGFDQNYYSFFSENSTSSWNHQDIRNELNGLFIYNDSDLSGIIKFNDSEITHMFIPGDVQATQFTTPGLSFGISSSAGSVTLNENDVNYNKSLDFGVNFFNVSGTTYPVIKDPFKKWKNVWKWQHGDVSGADLNNFTNTPTKAVIDEIGFQLHFNIEHEPLSTNSNANANLKLDQTIGNWNLASLKGRDILKGLSLAITYLTAIQANSYSIYDDNNTLVLNNQTIVSDSFSYNTEGKKFGSANLSGKYLWDKNQSVQLNSTTYSVPIDQFQSLYQSSDDKELVFGFNLQISMFFLAIGFPQWEGYKIFQDPTFNALTAVSGKEKPTNVTNNQPPVIKNSPVVESSYTIGNQYEFSWVAEDTNPASYVIKDEIGDILQQNSWFSGVPINISLTVKSGTHIYTITFYDTTGESSSDSITIIGVVSTSQTASTKTNTSITSTKINTTIASTKTNTTIKSTKANTQSFITTISPGFTVTTFLFMISLATIGLIYRRKNVN